MKHGTRPVQAPLHATKRHPGCGFARTRTFAPNANWPLQRDAHVMPAGVLTTFPRPRTETVSVTGPFEKIAVAAVEADAASAHVGCAPEHAPSQRTNA